MIKISVIIPTYNEEKNILECVESILSQKTKDFEVIIVDDGSTDKTLEILEVISKTLPVKVYKQNHKGPASARNLGAKHAKGKILVFVDSDMIFSRDFLQNLVKDITDNKTKGTFSKDEYVSNYKNVWARCWNVNENLPSKRRLPINYPNVQKVFRAILKSEFDRVNGFSKGGYTDDYTLSEKLGYEATAANEAVFYHKNPRSLSEVFSQAKWIGKRKYKFGQIGYILALFRASLPVSFLIGIYKSILNHNFNFLIFKIVYDLGVFIGILEMLMIGKTAK
jgi:glycosyltransferase involved in cell wall biosynthesis